MGKQGHGANNGMGQTRAWGKQGHGENKDMFSVKNCCSNNSSLTAAKFYGVNSATTKLVNPGTCSCWRCCHVQNIGLSPRIIAVLNQTKPRHTLICFTNEVIYLSYRMLLEKQQDQNSNNRWTKLSHKTCKHFTLMPAKSSLTMIKVQNSLVQADFRRIPGP